jgi:hypothetical protein
MRNLKGRPCQSASTWKLAQSDIARQREGDDQGKEDIKDVSNAHVTGSLAKASR